MGWLFGLRWAEGFLLLDSPGLTHADAISLRLGPDCGSTISLLVCLEAGRLSAWASHFFPLWPLLQANLGSFLGVAGVSAMRERASQVLFRPLLVLCSPFETSHAAAQIQGGEWTPSLNGNKVIFVGWSLVAIFGDYPRVRLWRFQNYSFWAFSGYKGVFSKFLQIWRER